MGKKKKLTQDEIKERRKLKERERRERIRNDPKKYEEHALKQKQRYVKNKEKGVIKLVKDMTPRELRQKRKNWKNNTFAYRKRKQILQKKLDNLPPENEIDEPLSDHLIAETRQKDQETLKNYDSDCSTESSKKRILLMSTPKSSRMLRYPSPFNAPLTIVTQLASSASEMNSNSSMVNTSVSRQNTQGRKTVRRDRSKINRENIRLRKENAELKRKLETNRKNEYRKGKRLANCKRSKNSDELTPNSKVRKMLGTCPSVPAEVCKNLLFGVGLEHQLRHNVKNIKSVKEKQIFAKVIQGRILKKYRLLTKAKNFLSSKMFKANKTRNNILSYERNKNSKKSFVERTVTEFYLSDDNSTQCPGKKDYITRKGERRQKKYLNTTLVELHKRFMDKNTFKISYALFCKYRPFWVVWPKIEGRDTCLCIQHENFGFMVSALKKENVISESSVDEILASLSCKPAKESCYLKKCKLCEKKIILYNKTDQNKMTQYKRWICTKEQRVNSKTKQEISVKITKKESVEATVGDLYVHLENAIPKFLVHVMNINHQFKIFNELKKNVSENETILHIDFSENYSCKYAREAQAVHFGASRQQITLHTGVMYTAGIQESFCTLSDSLRHDSAAVMAHIMPVLKRYLDNKNTLIDTLHFVSDSPATQYRNKKIFYLLQHFLPGQFPCLKKITWNYSEAGHGKGAPDGVGGTIKRTCDRLVSLGNDIENFEKFVDATKQNIEKIYIETITEKSIENIDENLPDFKLINPFKGTLKVHQVRWQKSGELEMNSLSCLCVNNPCEEYGLGIYTNTALASGKMQRSDKNQRIKNQEKDDWKNMDYQQVYEKDDCVAELQVGDWVKFRYQNQFFPGEIEKVDTNLITISAMETANPDLRTIWKWPAKPDVLEYGIDDVKKKIRQPVPCGSRLRSATFNFTDETF